MNDVASHADSHSASGFVGRPIERVEDSRLLRGRGRYLDDIVREGQVYAAILRSSVGHGLIRRIDVAAARAMPGVVTVLTAADIGAPIPVIPARAFPNAGMEMFCQPVIAHDKVRFVGEPIAVVVADTPARAEDALGFVEVEIEPLDPAAALFEQHGSNDAFMYRSSRGDIENAFRRADYTRRERLYVHRHTGITMETRGVLSEWDAGAQKLTSWGAFKMPFANRRILAAMMHLPEDSVLMVEGDVGGSFGVRGEFFPEDFLVPFAARLIGRPVKWVEDRREHLLAVTHARDVACDIEIACSRDGVVLGLRAECVVDTGAYFRTTTTVTPRNVAQFMPGPYRVPNYSAQVTVRLSSKSPSGTFRGPGRYESDYFRERMFDLAASDLGIDQAEFRRRNLVAREELPYAMPSIEPFSTPTDLDSGDYEHVLGLCLKAARWEEKRALQGKQIDGRYHGLAVGCFIEGGAAGPHENARMVLEKDGTVSVYVGSSAVGQGLETVMTQIAADALELSMDRIRIFHGTTSYVKSGIGSFHSRSTVMGGNAVLMAAGQLIERIRQAAAEILQCNMADVTYKAGVASSHSGGSVTLAGLDAQDIDSEALFTNSKYTYTYGSHVAHVAVDSRTGHVEIVDYVAFEDAGRIINPLTLHGQALGSIVHGLGGVLLEHLIYDESGQMLSGSLADYLVPLATDFPNIRSQSLELYPSPNHPLGAKGAGEGGTIPVAGVIANAVAAALASFGVQPLGLPLTPDRVWSLIQNSRTANGGGERLLA